MKCPNCKKHLWLKCTQCDEMFPELTTQEENILELVDTIARDIFEVRKMITDRPQLLTENTHHSNDLGDRN